MQDDLGSAKHAHRFDGQEIGISWTGSHQADLPLHDWRFHMTWPRYWTDPAALLVPMAPDAATCNGDTKSLALSCSAAAAEEFIFTIEIPDREWPKMAAYATFREVLPRALRR